LPLITWFPPPAAFWGRGRGRGWGRQAAASGGKRRQHELHVAHLQHRHAGRQQPACVGDADGRLHLVAGQHPHLDAHGKQLGQRLWHAVLQGRPAPQRQQQWRHKLGGSRCRCAARARASSSGGGCPAITAARRKAPEGVAAPSAAAAPPLTPPSGEAPAPPPPLHTCSLSSTAVAPSSSSSRSSFSATAAIRASRESSEAQAAFHSLNHAPNCSSCGTPAEGQGPE
jgi:hypothetical protein